MVKKKRGSFLPETSSLHNAVFKGNIEEIECLLKTGESINCNNSVVSPLHYAVLFGHLHVVDFLLKKGADINARTRGLKQTPIHWAAKWGMLDCLEALVRHGGSLKVKDGTCSSNQAIHLAAIYGRIDIVDWMLYTKPNTNIDIPNREGMTPLFLAVKFKEKRMVEYLITRGANVNVKNSKVNNITPLHLAVELGHRHILKVLLRNAADATINCSFYNMAAIHWAAKLNNLDCFYEIVEFTNCESLQADNIRGDYPMHVAAYEGNIPILNYLLLKGVSLNSRNKFGASPLHDAVMYDKIDVVKFLLEKGADVNDPIENKLESTCLHVATRKESFDMVKLLLENGADPNLENTDKQTPVHYAVECDRVDLLMQLEDYGGCVFEQDEFFVEIPLITAARNDSFQAAEWLLDNNVPVNVRDAAGTTALHHAAHHNSLNVGKLLISRGAVVNVTDNAVYSRMTPQHYAACRGNILFTELLLESGADLNIQTAGGVTPLHMAANQGELGTVQVMVAFGGDILKQNNNLDCDYPIHSAAKFGHLHVVEWLLTIHDDVDIKNKSGFTALHYAAMCGHVALARFLLQKKADFNSKSILPHITPLHLATQGHHNEIIELFLTSVVENASNVAIKKSEESKSGAKKRNRDCIRNALRRTIREKGLQQKREGA